MPTTTTSTSTMMPGGTADEFAGCGASSGGSTMTAITTTITTKIAPKIRLATWLRPFAARLSDGRLVSYLPSAALLDNGASDPRQYREVRFGGFPAGASVRLRYHDPRTMALRLEEDRPAGDDGVVTVTRGMLAAMPSMEDWVVEAVSV